MDREQMERILRHTLADAKMSRGERGVLRQVVAESGADDRELAFWRNRAFEIARDEIDNLPDRAILDWLEDAIRVFSEPADTVQRPVEAYFTPGDNAPRKIASLLVFAKKTVDICVFTITDDRITEGIIEAHDHGVRVRIISDNDKALDAGSDIAHLERRGIEVRVDRSEYHMHHKFAVFDNATTLTGSYNWTRGAAERNAENFILSYDPDLAAQFTAEFNRLWKSFA